MISVTPEISIAPWELSESFARASGPGGQNVNKVSSAVEIWAPVASIEGLDEHALARLRVLAGSKLTKEDEIHIRCEDARSQRDNRETVLERLAELVRRAAVRPKRRKKTKPSRGSRERRIKAKKERGEIKQLRQKLH